MKTLCRLSACSLAFAFLALALPCVLYASPQPVLMVIANRDFYYQEYKDTRSSLEARGLAVVVAAATMDPAIPQRTGGSMTSVRPDIAVRDANAANYSAVVFVGGWGASMYQYGFDGTYSNPAYGPNPAAAGAVNQLINDFVAQDKYVAAISHGVSVLAWARVNGTSPVKQRKVESWSGGGPGFTLDKQTYADSTVATRWHIERNGGFMPLSAAVGDPHTFADDVIVDGRIITAENFDSAPLFGAVIAEAVLSTAGRK